MRAWRGAHPPQEKGLKRMLGAHWAWKPWVRAAVTHWAATSLSNTPVSRQRTEEGR